MSMKRLFKGRRSRSKMGEALMPPLYREDSFTITTVHSPSTATFDLVFIHGFGGGWEQTWQGFGSSQSWLATLLPEHLPTARIMAGGFDAVGSINARRERFKHDSRTLHLALVAKRQDAKREIVFVAHSLGGLIVQEILAQTTSLSIFNATVGVIFLGTPHFRSERAWIEFGAKLVKSSISKEEFLPDPGVLGGINREFYAMLADREPNKAMELCFFSENLPMYRIDIIVPETAAKPPDRDSVSLDVNHIDLTRPTGVEDRRFTLLLEAIKHLARKTEVKISPQTEPRAENPPNSGVVSGAVAGVYGLDIINSSVGSVLGDEGRSATISSLKLQSVPVTVQGEEMPARAISSATTGMVQEGETPRTALYAAASKGHVEVVRMLLRHGAEIDAERGEVETPLEAAVFGDHIEVVKLLLENRAETNFQGGGYGKALQAAALTGHERATQLLLEHGADPNAQDGEYGNALQIASSNGHLQVVQLLVAGGATVNARGGKYGTALQAAAAGAHTEILRVLLQAGANVNSEGGKYGTALQAAAENGHLDAANLLIEYGADVNAQSRSSGHTSRRTTFERDNTLQEKPIVVFTIPFARNPNFTGRHEVFRTLDERFKNPSCVSLTGLGSIGKTQVAIEYCYQFRGTHPSASVLWINASTSKTFERDFIEIGSRLGLYLWDDPNADKAQLVSHWLRNGGGTWLLVLDNADDLDTFFSNPGLETSDAGKSRTMASYLPMDFQGYTLITTRNRRVGDRLSGHQNCVEVLPMSVTDAKSLLYTLLSPSLGADLDVEASKELLEILEFIPMAITQAAAFIRANRVTIKEYLDLFRTNERELLSEAFEDPRRYPGSENSVLATLKLTFNAIAAASPQANELLSLMAFLDSDSIPKELLRNESNRAIDTTRALGTLLAFSVIVPIPQKSSYQMHRIVQISVWDWLEKNGQRLAYEEKALFLLNERFPSGEYETWKCCSVLLPHLEALMRNRDVQDTHPIIFANLSRKMAVYTSGIGLYATAFASCNAALAVQRKFYGGSNIETMIVLQTLGMILSYQGKYEEAEQLHRDSLVAEKSALGREHPQTLTSMFYLAVALSGQGKDDEAQEIYLQLLEVQKRVWGDENLHTLRTVEKLASLASRQGDYEKAERMYQDLIMSLKNILGAEHPETLEASSGIAILYNHQGRKQEALELHEHVWTLREQLLGPMHPQTLESMREIAESLFQLGRYEQAATLFQKTLQRREQILGFDHPATTEARQGLRRVLALLETAGTPKSESLVLRGATSLEDVRTKMAKSL